ncbi:MAG TPA: hypothetical protein VHZ28_09680 [Terracidiphilus sp.]|nr:hypothetical protein [Terracidiphilus sp.]
MTEPHDDREPGQFDALVRAFSDQLTACLEECARGRTGLFSDLEGSAGEEQGHAWPEAARLRELAFALQAVLNQADERNALCDEFLDLCTMHGEHHPGEPRLARMFLSRIERSEVGAPTEPEKKPW